MALRILTALAGLSLALFAMLTGMAANAQTAAGAGQVPIAIVGADVLTMTDDKIRPNRTVLISGDRITAIGARGDVAIPASARRIDGRGMTLLPGLVDMHVHVAPVPGEAGDAAQRAISVMLAHGTTTARGMAGSPANLAVRSAIESGQVAGPRLYAASPAIHLGKVQSAEAAREAVRAASEAGFDLIKSHHLPDPAVWQAVQEEAAKLGLPTAGHVANEVGIGWALAADQQIEHLDGFIYELLPVDAPERTIEFGQAPPPDVLAAAGAASDARIAEVARRVKASGAFLVPTLSLFEKISDLATPTETLLADPAMRYIPESALRQWTEQRGQFAEQTGYTPEVAEGFRELRRRIVAALHREGVPMMAGSDTAQNFHVWGPALIDEIAAFEAAGLTPIEALKTATVHPRDYFRSLPNGGSALGWKADFGTVEPGARADLLLVRGDPSRDLSALRQVEAVIAGGEVHDLAKLDAMLAAAAAAAKRLQYSSAAVKNPVFVVRHLNTPQGAQDPELTDEGNRNALLLGRHLAGAGIKRVFATRTRRAVETGNAVAAPAGLGVTYYDPADVAALMKAVAATDGPVLIVGHSNTVPDLVAAFGGVRPGPLVHEDFGTVWRIAPGGATETHQLGAGGA